MADTQKNPDELGALWLKKNDRGEYMTGTINGEKVVAWKNTKKTKDNQPDWRIFKSKPFNAPTMRERTPRRDEDVDGL